MLEIFCIAYPRGTYDSVEFASLVALRLPLGVPTLAGAELSKILRGARGHVGK